MKLALDVRSLEWWIWTVTLTFLIAAVAGWTPGYLAVIIVSFLQIPYIVVKSKGVLSFASQVRIVYFGLTLSGLWEGGRVYLFAALSIGTVMVVLFDRCSIALVLKKMPWNREMENPQCRLPGA